MNDHIVKWRATDGERRNSLWMTEAKARALAEEVFDNGASKITVEKSTVCGHQPVLMLRC